MNAHRFPARNTREALAQVRRTLGDDAVVLSTRSVDGGVEVLAMSAHELTVVMPAPAAQATARTAALPAASASAKDAERSVQADTTMLEMSTLSFQDYVRDRMLRRRRKEMGLDVYDNDAAPTEPDAAPAPTAPVKASVPDAALSARPGQDLPVASPAQTASIVKPHPDPAPADAPSPRGHAAPSAHDSLLHEVRSMKGFIEAHFAALGDGMDAHVHPMRAAALRKLREAGFSPSLGREIVGAMPKENVDAHVWLIKTLASRMAARAATLPIEESEGVVALVGPTGVGKTTTTAKIAAAFAARHGAGKLALVTLDAHRAGGHEALRAWGRMLGVPVHTAHDKASLDDLLALSAAKRLVLVDTVGLSHRDARARDAMDLVSHASIRRVLVLNATAQGETLDDVIATHQCAALEGVVISKVDEAAKLGPCLDVVLRHGLRTMGVANGQRVPEDWHPLDAAALIDLALTHADAAPWRLAEPTDRTVSPAAWPAGTPSPVLSPSHGAPR